MELGINRADIIEMARRTRNEKRMGILKKLETDIQSALQEALKKAQETGESLAYGDIKIVIPDYFKGPLGGHFIPKEIETKLKGLGYSMVALGNLLIIW